MYRYKRKRPQKHEVKFSIKLNLVFIVFEVTITRGV